MAWLRDLILPPKRPRTRLREEDVRRLAQTLADRDGVADPISVHDVRRIDDRLCWVLGTTIKDASWTVTVDDQTGEAGQPTFWSGWRQSR